MFVCLFTCILLHFVKHMALVEMLVCIWLGDDVESRRLRSSFEVM